MTEFFCRSVEQQYDDDVCAWHTEAQCEVKFWNTRTAMQYPWPYCQRKAKAWAIVRTLCEQAINGDTTLRFAIIKAQMNALSI